MNFLESIILTETQYATQKNEIKLNSFVTIVSDSDPTVIVGIAVGNQEIVTGEIPSANETYLTNSDDRATLPYSVNLGGVGTEAIGNILINTPNSGVASISAFPLTAASTDRLLSVSSGGSLTASNGINFGLADVAFTNMNSLTMESTTGFDFNTGVFRANGGMESTNLTLTAMTAGSGTAIVDLGGGVLGLETSSLRFKENVEPYSFDLDKVKKISVKQFNYKDDKDKKNNVGLIAEEVYELYPELVNLDAVEKLPYSINFSALTILLLEKIKQLEERIENFDRANNFPS